MMRWHRLCAILAGVLLVYIVVTGAGIQLADMRALVFHAPETDPDMLMMRQHINGPPNYSVVSAPDYTAPVLPAGLDYAAAIRRTAALGHAAAPKADLRMVELRMAQGKPAGLAQMGGRQLIFDLGTGRALLETDLPPAPPPNSMFSPRAWFKFFHRFNYLGQWATGLNGLAGIVFEVMIFTGITHYVRLHRARAALGRGSLGWRAGGWWRDLHRWVAVGAGVVVVWITLTGLALSIDNFYPWLNGVINGRPHQSGPNGFDGDLGGPISDAQLSPMTQATLAAFHAAMPGTGVKVLQLRYFSGYAQGVVVAADPATTQLVFNTRTGARMSMSEKGYPFLGFPAGWEWHQRLKQMHRGDYFGMTGRWLDTLGALSMVYLSISGLVMYFQMWNRRRRAGRTGLVWG